MLFGVKVRQIRTNHAYSIETFYEAIRGKIFTAGQPSLIRHGGANIIIFPPLDRLNQVQILPADNQPETHNFRIQKAKAVRMPDVSGNSTPSRTVSGIFILGQMIGKNAKRCETLVDMTAEELKLIRL